MREKLYYVYTLAYPDGEVFYVGKGSGDRLNQHEWKAARETTSHPVSDIIRSIWFEGGLVVKTKVYETFDEEDAYAYERSVIHQHGLDALVNKVERQAGAPRKGEKVRRYVQLSLDPLTLAALGAMKVNKSKLFETLLYEYPPFLAALKRIQES